MVKVASYPIASDIGSVLKDRRTCFLGISIGAKSVMTGDTLLAAANGITLSGFSRVTLLVGNSNAYTFAIKTLVDDINKLRLKSNEHLTRAIDSILTQECLAVGGERAYSFDQFDKACKNEAKKWKAAAETSLEATLKPGQDKYYNFLNWSYLHTLNPDQQTSDICTLKSLYDLHSKNEANTLTLEQINNNPAIADLLKNWRKDYFKDETMQLNTVASRIYNIISGAVNQYASGALGKIKKLEGKAGTTLTMSHAETQLKRLAEEYCIREIVGFKHLVEARSFIEGLPLYFAYNTSIKKLPQMISPLTETKDMIYVSLQQLNVQQLKTTSFPRRRRHSDPPESPKSTARFLARTGSNPDMANLINQKLDLVLAAIAIQNADPNTAESEPLSPTTIPPTSSTATSDNNAALFKRAAVQPITAKNKGLNQNNSNL